MLRSIVNLFFPKVCFACLHLLNDNEHTICVHCRHDLPVTHFHFNDDDAIQKVLYGRAMIQHGTALFRFEKKGKVQQLIHGLKYRGYEHLSGFLGDWLGGELQTLEAYRGVDMVIPVPLHKKKLKKRGYNQVAGFGQRIAAALDADYRADILIKVVHTESQVHKKQFERWQNNDVLFALHHQADLNGKHILLVDDIITTGATLEACITVLNGAEDIKISIATMAIA